MRRALAAAFAGIVGLAGTASAEGRDPQEELQAARRRVAELREQVLALQTLRDLDLSAAQARDALALAREARIARIAFESQRALVLEEQVRAFYLFALEDSQDKPFTPAVERDAARADHRGKAVEEEFVRAVNALEPRLLALLTPAQRERVEDGPASTPRDPRRASGIERAEDALAAVRAMGDDEWRRRSRILATAALASLGARRDVDQAPLVEGLVAAIDRYREAPEDQLPALAKGIFERFFPGVRAEQIGRELARIHQDRYGALGPAGRFLASPAAVPALEALVARLGPPRTPAGTSRKDAPSNPR